MYNYGLIGNCQISAFVSLQGSVDWLCMPRPDSPPVFGQLLDPDGGHFSIQPDAEFSSHQYYISHSNILVTHFLLKDGSEFRTLDFCPRFIQHGRVYRPATLIRVVEPLKGENRIRVRCQPVDGWSKKSLHAMRASSHVRWELNGDNLRLNTNMSITQLLQGDSFSLKGKVYFALSWSSPFQEDLARTIEDYLKETERYWDMWVKHCSIPMLFQEQTIRSALTLKLHCYEDTGAILAALTTSLPEEVGGVRNWDYRFCWLRDAYFVLSALNNLGHFEEMEGFLRFLLNTAAGCDIEKDGLGPVYTLDHRRPVPERLHENWQGFHGSQPVRSNNQAGDHVQNDVYGEMVLSLTPIFFDERFFHFRSMDYERLLESLVRLCAKTISQPDAGLWELRGGWNEHTFSNLTCWAGLERAQRLQKLGFLRHVNLDVNREVQRADQALRRAVQGGSLRNSPTDPTFDASLLLLPVFRYPDEALCEQTVLAIHEALRIPWNQSAPSPFLYRYLRHDDFGTPESAFMICSFWLVQSLARIGRKEQGIEILKNLLPAANHLGLFSEHFDPKTKQQLGNFPQAYSHVGQINATFAVSPLWSEIL